MSHTNVSSSKTADLRADTWAALELLVHAGTPFFIRLRNPGLTEKEKLELLAVCTVILSTGSRLMLTDPYHYMSNLLRSEGLVLQYADRYVEFGGPQPKRSSVEMLIGDEES